MNFVNLLFGSLFGISLLFSCMRQNQRISWRLKLTFRIIQLVCEYIQIQNATFAIPPLYLMCLWKLWTPLQCLWFLFYCTAYVLVYRPYFHGSLSLNENGEVILNFVCYSGINRLHCLPHTIWIEISQIYALTLTHTLLFHPKYWTEKLIFKSSTWIGKGNVWLNDM